MDPTVAFVAPLLVMLIGPIVVGTMVGLGRRVGGVRSWAAILASASVVGCIFGSVAVYVAIQRNSQGSIIDETGAVDYAYLSALFLSWLLAAQITASLIFVTILVLLKGANFLLLMLLRRIQFLRPRAPSSRVRRE